MHAPISSPINKPCSLVALVRCWSVITLGVGPRDQTDVLTLVEERERSDITNLWIYHNPIDTNSIVYDRLPLIRSDYVHFLAISKPIRFFPNIIDEELFGTVNKLFPCQQVHFYIHINRKGLMCTIWVKSYFFVLEHICWTLYKDHTSVANFDIIDFKFQPFLLCQKSATPKPNCQLISVIKVTCVFFRCFWWRRYNKHWS